MLAFDAPTFRLQMRIDRRNARAQGFVARDKDDIRIVGREWLGVINRCEQVQGSKNVEHPYRRLGQTRAAQYEWNCCERKYGRYQIAKCGRIRKLRRHSGKSGAASEEHQSQMPR